MMSWLAVWAVSLTLGSGETIKVEPARGAELIVIADVGPTTPMARYMEGVSQRREGSIAVPKAEPLDLSGFGFPVRTTELSPGKVEAKQFDKQFAVSPWVIVGDDPISRSWLTTNAATLAEMKVVGYVVNVETRAALSAMQSQYPWVQLQPISGGEMASLLGIRHYPVLITGEGVYQ